MASGMSAVSIIAELAKPGDNVVITKDVYGGTTNYFSVIRSPLQTIRSVMDRLYRYDTVYRDKLLN